MIEWQQLLNALGRSEISSNFIKLKDAIEEPPVISEDPIEYNDPEKRRENLINY